MGVGCFVPMKVYNLMVTGQAQCATNFPCQATGGYEANNPPAFTGSYTVSATAAPEPATGLLVSVLIGAIAVRRRLSAVC